MRRTLTCAFVLALASPGCGDDAPAGRNDPVPPPCDGECRYALEVVEPATAVLRMTYNQTGVVTFKYSDQQGAPLAGFQVNFVTVGATGGSILQASSGTTDALGQVTATLLSQDAEADFELVATALKADAVRARISVRSKEGGDVEVRLAYRGRKQLTGARVMVLRSPVDCAALNPAEPPTAIEYQDVVSLRDRARFTLATGTQVGILAVATGGGAAGCHAGPVEIRGGVSESVLLELEDVPPSYAGTYDVTTNLDLVEALPEGIAFYIDELGSLFQDPGATAVDWLRRAGVSIPDVLSGVIAELATQAFEEYTAGTTVGTVFQAGGEIYDIFSATELRSTLIVHSEPGEDGRFAEEALEERWDTLVVRWTTGVCEGAAEEASADGCGVNEFGFVDADMNPIHAYPEGSVDLDDPYRLTIEPHGVTLDYGKLGLFIIEKIVLPRTVGYESFDDFIYELLGGMGGRGRGCLSAAATDPGDDTPEKVCCRAFSEAVTEDEGLTRTTARGLCNSGVGLVIELVRGRVETLQADSGENMTIGTKSLDGESDIPCEMWDQDGDNVVEALGQPPARRCTWQVQVAREEGDPIDFTGAWHGARR